MIHAGFNYAYAFVETELTYSERRHMKPEKIK
jgi:hypothetical protein